MKFTLALVAVNLVLLVNSQACDQAVIEPCIRAGFAGILGCGNADACLCPQIASTGRCFDVCPNDPLGQKSKSVLVAESTKRCAGTGNAQLDINGLINGIIPQGQPTPTGLPAGVTLTATAPTGTSSATSTSTTPPKANGGQQMVASGSALAAVVGGLLYMLE